MKASMKVPMKAKVSKFLAPVVAVLGALTLSMNVHAEHIKSDSPFDGGIPFESLVPGNSGESFSSTQFVWGNALNINALSLSGAGTVTVNLTDLGFPTALDTLKLLVTDLDGIWQSLDGTGSLLIDVSGPTKLFAAVFARSTGDSLGLYNINASFAPVPLPAAAWLLLSGLGGLGLFRRKGLTTSDLTANA